MENLLFKSEIDNLLKDYFESLKIVEDQMLEKIKNYTLRGGKRIRAAILYYTYLGYSKKNLEQVKKASMSMELLQSALLIHDDLIDNDNLRRGEKTLHESYKDNFSDKKSESLSILAGDLCYTLCYEILSNINFDAAKIREAVKILSECVRLVIYGQVLDVQSEISIKQKNIVDEINYYKTATYTAEMPIRIGLSLAGIENQEMVNFGKKIGIAFQLQDDLLGATINMGKDICSDIREGKMNNLTRLILERANNDELKSIKLMKGRQLNKADINIVKEIITKYEIDKEITKQYDKLLNEAKDLIPDIINEESKIFFVELVETLRNRRH